MLSWSGKQSEIEIDLVAVKRGSGDVGVAHADELMQFADAAARLDADVAEMRATRDALVSVAGAASMVDAAAVAGNFHMMTRLADGTGARYPQARMEASATTIEIMGTADMISMR